MASKNATTYAFEPTKSTFEMLKQTALLNDSKIIPVNAGLGAENLRASISANETNSGGNRVLYDGAGSEEIQVTSIDCFVETNHIERIDFIKADIEGAERDMLKGAKNTLAKFAPKLAICTYHLPDDPQVLEALILDANPNYSIIHIRHKLFACVVKK